MGGGGAGSGRRERDKNNCTSPPLLLLLLLHQTTTNTTTTACQNNQAFDKLVKAGGPSISSLLSGPTSDLKKILLFHVSSTRYTDADIPPGKVVSTELPGASLKAVLSPSGRGVEIGPSSYSGKNVGPAGAGVLGFSLPFFATFLLFHRKRGRDASIKKKGKQNSVLFLFLSLSLSLSLSLPPSP